MCEFAHQCEKKNSRELKIVRNPIIYLSTIYLAFRESLFLLLYSLFESNLSIRGHFLTCELFLWSQLRLPILCFLHFSTCVFAFRRSASYLYEVILQLFIKFMNCDLIFFFHIYQKLLVAITRRINIRRYFTCYEIYIVPVKEKDPS